MAALLFVNSARLCEAQPAIGIEQKLQQAISTYQPAVDNARSILLKNVPKEDARRIAKATFEIVPSDAPMGFSTISVENGLISISVGGLRTEAMIVEASLINSVDNDFFLNYMIYLRRQHLKGELGLFPNEFLGVRNDKFVDSSYMQKLYGGSGNIDSPLKKLGMSPKLALQATVISSNAMVRCAYLFTMAHEACHLVNNDQMEPLPNENRAAYLVRLRQQEERADAYAIAVMRRSNLPTYCMGPLFLGLELVYEPRNEPLERNPHPPDIARMVKICKAALVSDIPLIKGVPSMQRDAQENLPLLIDQLERFGEEGQMLKERDNLLRKGGPKTVPRLHP